MAYDERNNPYWWLGFNAGYAGNAYGPHDHGALSYQQVAAYQRGYNAGCEELIEARREASTVWREERS